MTRAMRFPSVTASYSADGFCRSPGEIFDDEHHSTTEPREIIIGHSMRKRLLLVCFVEKEDTIRIISARIATRRERQDYEEDVQS